MYKVLLFLHIISFICWMAGLFYLPRLFVYHATVEFGSQSDKLFQTMERKLLKIIMNPSLILTFITGVALARLKFGGQAGNHWLTVKGFFAVLLAIYHIYLVKIMAIFSENRNTKSHVFYRYLNEVPTIFLIVIVSMVVFRPF